MTNPEFTLRPERAEDEPALRELAEAIFGPGRFARTPYRVREGAAVAGELSGTAGCGVELAGSVRCTPIRSGAPGGARLSVPLLRGATWARVGGPARAAGRPAGMRSGDVLAREVLPPSLLRMLPQNLGRLPKGSHGHVDQVIAGIVRDIDDV